MQRSNLSQHQKLIIQNKIKNYSWSIFRIVLFIGLTFIIIYPILYMISMSFRSVVDTYDVSVKWIPKTFTFYNIEKVWKAINYPGAIGLTVFISLVSTIFLMISCSVTGYGLARFKFRGSEIIFVLVLLTIIVPQQFFVLPLFLEFKYFNFFGLSNVLGLFTGETHFASILDTPLTFFLPAVFGIGIRSGLYIYIFRQFFKSMPKELEEAAYIDGMGSIKTFFKIIVPNAVPAFVTSFLFSFVWHWNDYQLSSMFLIKSKTLSSILVNILNIIYESNADISAGIVVPDTNQMAIDVQVGCFLVVIPMVLLYLILQRFFTESIERTGIVE